MVIILINTNLVNMTATLDSGPVTKTVFTHSLTQSAQTTTRRTPFADGSPTQSPVEMEGVSTIAGVSTASSVCTATPIAHIAT